MNTDQIRALQSHLKSVFDPNLKVDGIWGKLSMTAARGRLRSLMPKNNPWPKPNQAAIKAFFGNPGDESNLVTFDFPFRVLYDGQVVTRGRAHKKVVESLVRVFKRVHQLYKNDRRIMDAISDYAGIYNYRPKRGGGSDSYHSWGIAIDLNPGKNGFKVRWPTQAEFPFEIMECFAEEGWCSAGCLWGDERTGYDAMHHEATNYSN